MGPPTGGSAKEEKQVSSENRRLSRVGPKMFRKEESFLRSQQGIVFAILLQLVFAKAAQLQGGTVKKTDDALGRGKAVRKMWNFQQILGQKMKTVRVTTNSKNVPQGRVLLKILLACDCGIACVSGEAIHTAPFVVDEGTYSAFDEVSHLAGCVTVITRIHHINEETRSALIADTNTNHAIVSDIARRIINNRKVILHRKLCDNPVFELVVCLGKKAFGDGGARGRLPIGTKNLHEAAHGGLFQKGKGKTFEEDEFSGGLGDDF